MHNVRPARVHRLRISQTGAPLLLRHLRQRPIWRRL